MTDGIFHLTGKPISFEMAVILESLANNIPVSSEDILNTYEYRIGKSLMIEGEETELLPYRQDIRSKVFDEMLNIKAAEIDENYIIRYTKEVKQGSRLDVVIGLPASGKSSAIVDIISNKYSARIIDNDEAKKLLPEYHDGFGSNRVHTESQNISDNVFKSAIFRGENIVLPKVGGNAEKLKKNYIDVAKQAGYSVHLHYVEIEKNIAQGRMIERYLGKSNRFLPVDLLDKYFDSNNVCLVDMTYEQLKKEEILDGYSKWNNAVVYGERPRLIEEYNNADGAEAIRKGLVRDGADNRSNILPGRQSNRQEITMGKGEPGENERVYRNAGGGSLEPGMGQSNNSDIVGGKNRVLSETSRSAKANDGNSKKSYSLIKDLKKHTMDANSKNSVNKENISSINGQNRQNKTL